MYSLTGRIVYGIVALALAAFLLARGSVWGWPLLAVPLLMAWGYFRYGPMLLAFKAYRRRDWPALERYLASVRRPEWLTAQNRAYFTLLSAVARSERGDLAGARTLLDAVPAEHLRTDNMRSVLEWHRAELALAMGDRSAAAEHLARARAIAHQQAVDEALAALERRLGAS